MMTIDGPAISEFWRWFHENATAIGAMTDADDPLWDTVLTRLRLVNAGLGFEMSDPSEDEREWVLTAYGDASLFPLADAMVKVAPAIDGWMFVARKPAMGFDFITTYEGVEFNSQAMWFLPLASASKPTDLALRIGIPGLDDRTRRVAGRAVMVVLDTGLGERSASVDVQHVEFEDLPPEPEKAGYIELTELPAYIAWWKRRIAKG